MRLKSRRPLTRFSFATRPGILPDATLVWKILSASTCQSFHVKCMVYPAAAGTPLSDEVRHDAFEAIIWVPRGFSPR